MYWLESEILEFKKTFKLRSCIANRNAPAGLDNGLAQKFIRMCGRYWLYGSVNWEGPDPGVFTQGQGYKFRSNDWLCGTRDAKGCPTKE